MTIRLAALALLLAGAACTSTSAPAPGYGFATPVSVAVFGGVTSKDPLNVRHPYLAVANLASDDLTIADAVDNSRVDSYYALRSLAFPVPNSPWLLVAASLGDHRPDLLGAVSSGGSTLQILRTWSYDGAIVGEVDFGQDILALAALPLDPAAPGTIQIAALLAGERVAVATFRRGLPSAPDALDVEAAASSVRTSAPLGFRPVALAPSPVTPGRVWVASPDDLGGGTFGVAGVDLPGPGAPGVPVIGQLLAGAPTRLVAAASLAERAPGAAGAVTTPHAFDGQPKVERVYAVLDESGCGFGRPIACGLAAFDPQRAGATQLAADFAGEAPFRAPIPLPSPLALAVSGPPRYAPTDDPLGAGTTLRLVSDLRGPQYTTAVAATADADGYVFFVDVARWTGAASQTQWDHVAVTTVTSTRPSSARPAGQWLSLADPLVAGTAIPHTRSDRLEAAIRLTPGYTPTALWTVVSEGALPGLSGLPATAGLDGGGLWVALHSGASATSAPVRVWDPTLGVRAGDTLSFTAGGVTACAAGSEASVLELAAPTADFPGGALRLAKKGVPAWDACVDALTAAAGSRRVPLSGTVRAGGFVLIRSAGGAVRHAGRPALGVPFALRWADESPGACTLPPAAPWPAGGPAGACDAACRARCDELVGIQLARRITYTPETCGACGWALPDPVGPAIAFTLALEGPAAPAARDLALGWSTSDGRFWITGQLNVTAAVQPRAIIPFDRSPYNLDAGVRFLVPYPSGSVLDVSPSETGTGNSLH